MQVKPLLAEKGIIASDDTLLDRVITLVKDRCVLLTDFVQQSSLFFKSPESWDSDAIKSKWTKEKKEFFQAFVEELTAIDTWESAFIEDAFKKLAMLRNIKPGELQLPLRIMLVGGKFGPPVFDIAAILESKETIARIQKALAIF